MALGGESRGSLGVWQNGGGRRMHMNTEVNGLEMCESRKYAECLLVLEMVSIPISKASKQLIFCIFNANSKFYASTSTSKQDAKNIDIK